MIGLLRKLVVEDCWLKLFSLGLAILIWLTVNTALPLAAVGERVMTGLPVLAVAAVSSPEEARSLSLNPRTVDVTVRGEPKILSILQKKDIRVTVDLTGVTGSHEPRVPVDVWAPPGVTYVRVDPSEVEVAVPASN